MNEPSTSYLALDPGETTGWAEFCDGVPVCMGEVPYEEVYHWLASVNYGLYVCEDYIIRPQSVQQGFNHNWNKGHALKIIGAVELKSAQQAAVLVMQQPSIKPVASAMSGVPYVKGKRGTHMHDAILHGRYYWIKEHGIDPEKSEVVSTDSDRPGVRPPTRVAHVDSLAGLRAAGRRAGVAMPRKPV